MALECSLVYELSTPVPFTCANDVGINKGSILKISDPATVAVTTGDADPVIGIAAADKIINDGNTKIPVYLSGIFKGYCGAGGVTAGMSITTDTATGAANELVDAAVNDEHIVGMALETATDGETFLFQLNPFAVNLA